MKKKTIKLLGRNVMKAAGGQSTTLVSVLTGATSRSDVAKQLLKFEKISALSNANLPDIVSDLSLENSGSLLYKEIIKNYPQFIIATLPIYQCKIRDGHIDPNELLAVSQEQIECGVGLITIHPTPTGPIMQLAQRRIVPWTSRGGAMIMKDLMVRQFKEDNAYLQILDDLIVLASKHGTVISIGASFRSANVFDSYDECQIQEFRLQKELAEYIYSRGVDVIIEGPGHSTSEKLTQIAVDYNQMGFPIMPLGPIPTDAAVGQDHISSAIGAVLLGLLGAVDIIAAVTREEHTGKIPSVDSSIEAIKAAKIAAHIIDMKKLGDYAVDQDVVSYRAEYQTCVYGKHGPGCSRCAHVCPLVDNRM